ncbi:MAG: hypothetical protein CML20_23405 [Rheinheimera sp.]|uniref:hypothetical protein n=1 Tax=Arsukibacterium sp. UBA3155 TaxID=1946058 RepID=UPI000C979197|nr:hypothetical protein [Arsukibacterium sp. UBA3155]MAD77676.1 hypothetical protein [Rheinheimera sp.]|tara:strand:+ start:42092 stop:42310 length:219 start_codon:yes stop_codon:yes gene_type:complete
MPSQLRLTGHVLSVYESSDTLATSCQSLSELTEQPQSFKELKIATGKLHGAFYLPHVEWVELVMDWVHQAGD